LPLWLPDKDVEERLGNLYKKYIYLFYIYY
jgi:hypothetical protein